MRSALRFEPAAAPAVSADDKPRRIDVPLAGLLDIALPRLKRQKPYAGPLARGGPRTAALEGWLDAATACLAELAHPSITLVPVAAQSAAGVVTLDGRIHLEDAKLADEILGGGEVSAYLLTLGMSGRDALAWLGGDYGARHVQSDLAREALFALGRRSLEVQHELTPGARLRRISVQTTAQCGDRSLWDPARVQALLGVFDGVNPGVTVSETGCFEPFDSLLGLTVRL